MLLSQATTTSLSEVAPISPETAPSSAADSILEGLNFFGGQLGLPNTDIRAIAANLIGIVLGFVGIIMVVVIIYAGFLWMLSGGDDEQRAKAKNSIVSAIIGLVIILSAYSIIRFVVGIFVGGGTTVEP